MPYDGKDFQVDETTKRRKYLCEMLRHGLDDYDFNYEQYHCGSGGCVAGWICYMWPEMNLSAENSKDELIGAVVGFNSEQTDEVFYRIQEKYLCTMKEVTGEMAANYIEELMGDEKA